MLASFIIGFHTARMDNLLQTLRFLTKWHPEVVSQSEIVTVCQDACDHGNLAKDLSNQCCHFAHHIHADLELDCMMLPYVTNLGVDRSTSDKVIILESDRILPPGYFKAVIEDIKPKTSITANMTHKLHAAATDEQIEQHQYEYSEDGRSHTNETGRRNMWSGNTAIWKADFYEAEKMDEMYKGYGWADTDMTNRMAEIGVRSVFRPEIELHLWHTGLTYGHGDQKRMFIDNGLRFCRQWNQPIPNWFREEISLNRKVLL